MSFSSAELIAADITAADRSSPTVFLGGEAGFVTYKSEMVTSNDTGFGVRYTLGGYIGQERTIGVLYTTDSNTVNFGINKGKIATSWTDLTIRYRFGPVYLGAIIGSMSLKLTPPEIEQETASGKTASAEELDVLASGYGGNAGFVMGFGRNNAWHLDVSTVSMGPARDINQVDVKVGPRLDIDTGVTFFVTREVFDIMLGYRMRSYSIKVEDTYKESVSATYLAFRLKSFF